MKKTRTDYVVEYLLSMGCEEVQIGEGESDYRQFKSPSSPLMFYFVRIKTGRVKCGKTIMSSYVLDIVPKWYRGD